MKAEPTNESRRGFVNWFLGTAMTALAGAVIYPVARFLSPPRVPESSMNQVDAGTVDDPELAEKGFKIVRFGARPVMVVKVGEGEFRAFSATCTHLDCIVEYQKKERRIFCNCHGGEYDLHGRNVAGPPPRPLERFDVKVLAASSGRAASLVISRA